MPVDLFSDAEDAYKGAPSMQEGRIIKTFQANGVDTTFRRPCAADLDAFIEMHRTLTREEVMCRRLELDRDSGRMMFEDIVHDLSQDKLGYILVEQDGRLVGEGFTNSSGYQYFTVGLALIDRARGMGIGTALMWALEEESRRLGARRLFLSVWSANPSAIHVYEKVGYNECGRRSRWVQMDDGTECDMIDMVKLDI